MKHNFTCSLLFCLLTSFSAFGQTQKLVGNLVVNYPSTNGPTGDSATMAYNSNFQLSERVNWKLDASGNWNFKSRSIDYDYDLNGNLIYSLSQNADGNNGWINSSRYTYTYDANGKEITYRLEKWVVDSAAWIDSQRKTSTYNQDGHQLSYY